MAESADILDAMYSYPGRPPIPAPTPAPTVPPPLIPVPTIIGIIGIIFLLLHGVLLFFRVCSFQRLRETSVLTDVMRNATSLATDVMRNATVERFLREMAKEKPIRFTPDQLIGFTDNYATRLGAGGFGTVYRGPLPNGLAVAVKVLHRGLDTKTSEAQFMAEMGTIGRTHHINLVRLYGFCFDADATATRALVYEFMEHGSLDDYLSCDVSMTTVAAVATGVARGLRYLHEECQHKIVHYDIKPDNVLLDGALTPKVADFGLARLVNRADTHVSLSCGRGTPGYAAPEVWMELRITEKCDVYSFGMLLLKIVRRGSCFNAQDAASGSESSQPWFPMVAWTRYEAGGLMELVLQTDMDDSRSRELVERMCCQSSAVSINNGPSLSHNLAPSKTTNNLEQSVD